MRPDLDLLRRDLNHEEGRVLEAYVDTVGKLTIGTGRCLDTNPFTPEEIAYIGHDGRHLPITDDQADYLLSNDLSTIFRQLDKYLPWWADLDEVRARVLADMCFNMGIKTLTLFKNTLAYIRDGQWMNAGDNMLQSKWAKQVRNRAVRLSKMMKTGIDQPPS